MREPSSIHVRLGLHMIGLTSRNNGFCRLDNTTERQVNETCGGPNQPALPGWTSTASCQGHPLRSGSTQKPAGKLQQPLMFCVSVSVLSELFRHVPRWMPNETQWFVSAKARWGHCRSVHNLLGDRSACLPVTRTTGPTSPNVIQQTKCVDCHQSNFQTANSVFGLPIPGFVQMHQNNPNCGHHKGH